MINEFEGAGNPGINSVMWGMTRRGRKKTPEEVARWDEQMRYGEPEPFYDYYDTNEFFGAADEEVGRGGRECGAETTCYTASSPDNTG